MPADPSPIDEPVHLEEHDPAWAGWFVAERERIRGVVAADVAIEHIGSTAVPGLVAKPIIDILVGVPPPHTPGDVEAGLVAIGYEPLGEAGVPGRAHLRRRGPRSYNVSVVALDGALWRDNLRFRDHLRSSRRARERYGRAKRRAVAAGHRTLLDYGDAKSPAIERLLAEIVQHPPPSRSSPGTGTRGAGTPLGDGN